MDISKRRGHVLLLLACTALLSSHPVSAQLSQQGSKLVGTGAAGNAAQGFSVAISADGLTAIVGGPDDNGRAGAAWIWTRDDVGRWRQQGAKLAGSGGTGISRQGMSVSISADGNTAAVGGPNDADLVGAVWVWTRNAGIWSQQGTKLVGTDVTGRARQGEGVALAADGHTLIVGGSGDNSDAGAAWIWTRSGGVWAQQSGKLVGTGATASAAQGSSVALASDGNTAIVGGVGDGSAGAVWIWSRSGGFWSQQGTKLVGSDTVGAASQGRAVSLSADGNTAIVGGQGDNGSVGAAWVWTRSAGTWTQQGPKLVGSGATGLALQGWDVSLSADGNRAIVGGVADDTSRGAAWVWTRNSGSWTQQGAKMVGTGAVGFAAQGHSAALSSDARTAISGGPYDNSSAGAVWIFTSPAAPIITTHPASQIVPSGATAAFTVAATGSPEPTVQWQVGALGGASFSDIAGATSTTYSFAVAPADHGKRFRAVFTNSSASATTGVATLTVSLPMMSLGRASLRFAAVTNGSSFRWSTPPQTVRLSQLGTDNVTWTAASNAPWLVVSPTSGTGGEILTISTQFVPGLTASQTGQIALVFSGAGNTAGPILVVLTTAPPSDPASAPFGNFDTPAGDATVLSGSVAVTGWTLDDIGVQRVELWRDLQPRETTTPFASAPTDPRNGKVFIANALFVDDARPDIEGLFPSTPINYRGGWGYLMLTWGLWDQGNGTYNLHAFAFDQENNVATIGTKAILVRNNSSGKPFGSIDTPAFGGEASGPNFGWALTHNVNDGARPGIGPTTCKIQPSGVQVSIDSGPLQPVVYGDFRPDVATAFPGFTNAAAAGGHYLFDWSTLTNGVHTIGWLVTDHCNRADGVGSRFFTVTTGQNLRAAATAAASVTAARAESVDVITVARGHGELPEILTPGDGGSRTIEVKQGERIEIRLPRGFESATQFVNGGQSRDLPTGSTWDAPSATFYWEPAAGFLGRYRLVFSNGLQRISVRVVVTP